MGNGSNIYFMFYSTGKAVCNKMLYCQKRQVLQRLMLMRIYNCQWRLIQSQFYQSHYIDQGQSCKDFYTLGQIYKHILA